MRLSAAEKREVIRLVEGSDLSVRRTLRELGVSRSTFYAWYERYREHGDAGLEPRAPAKRRHWNRIPDRERKRVVDAALADPEKSPRELAWQMTDRTGHFVSESSVYRRERGEGLPSETDEQPHAPEFGQLPDGASRTGGALGAIISFSDQEDRYPASLGSTPARRRAGHAP